MLSLSAVHHAPCLLLLYFFDRLCMWLSVFFLLEYISRSGFYPQCLSSHNSSCLHLIIVRVCVIMAKCCPGDICCSGNYHSGGCEHLAGVCLLDRFCHHPHVTHPFTLHSWHFRRTWLRSKWRKIMNSGVIQHMNSLLNIDVMTCTVIMYRSECWMYGLGLVSHSSLLKWSHTG